MNQEYLYSHPNEGFICDSCDRKFRNETAYSPSPSLAQGYHTTYCINCVEITEEELGLVNSRTQPQKKKKK